jgi:hypothetical protein
MSLDTSNKPREWTRRRLLSAAPPHALPATLGQRSATLPMNARQPKA